jgi:WD40 repeat protein
VVVSGTSEGVRLWDAVSGGEIAVLGGHVGWVSAVALGRAGDREVVVSGCSDGGVRLWDAVSGDEIAVLGGQRGVVLSVALGRVGERNVVMFNADHAVGIVDIDRATLQFGPMLILGPGRETLLDLVPDGVGGYRLNRLSDDAWRYWRAQGFADGRLVNIPIDDMPRAV